MSLALTYVTGIVSLFFTASLLRPVSDKAELSLPPKWGLAFVLVAVSMLLWFLRETFGLSESIFRVWYITGGETSRSSGWLRT